MLLGVAGFLLVSAAALIPAMSASAANLQFKWLDKTHMQVTGVDPSPIITFPSSDGGKTLGNGSVGLLASVKITYNGKSNTIQCYLPKIISFQNNTIGRNIIVAANMTPPGPSSGTGQGPQRCPLPNVPNEYGAHSDANDFKQFDGNYTTTNDWPGNGGGSAPEAPNQQVVAISITSWAADSPKTFSVTLTPDGKAALPAVTSTAQVAKTGDSSEANAKYYTYTATVPGVPPGGFKACVTYNKKAYCDTNTKIVYQPSSAFITVGAAPEGSDTKEVLITAEYDNPTLNDPGVAQTFGPYNIDLKQGDKVIQTQKASFKYEPSPECKNASVRACGTSLIQDGVYFTGIAPGKYQACLQGTTTCTSTFTKDEGDIAGFQDPILLKLTSSDISAAANGQSDADSADCGAGDWNWVICPLTTLMAKTATALDSFITSQMTVSTSNIFGNSDSAQAYYKAWNTFRIIGTALIVIAGLVMVASEAFGFELLDAYTIRKTLPRLLVAIIGMSLSWPLLEFVIGFFNVLGNDIEQLIFAPFSGIASHAQGLGATVNWTVVVAGILAAATGYGAVLFPIIGMGMLSLLLAFLIIVVREVAVTLLVILAPFAIAAYVLPNTKKVWDLWRENFLGLMVMFPIVMALIAAGHVFAAIGDSGSVVQQFVGLIAYFIGYFLILFAFRAATGLISTLTGLVNDKSKGAFDRLKNSRNNKMARANEHNGRRIVAARKNAVDKLQAAGSTGNFAKRVGARALAKGVGGYNISQLDAARQAAVSKEIQDIKNTGDDSEIRALTARKVWNEGKKAYEWRTLAGKEVNEAQVKAAYSRWGNDAYAQQAALSYEMSKASSEDEKQNIVNGYSDLALNHWKQSEGRATAQWIGSAFENQNSSLEYKNMRMQHVLDADGNVTKQVNTDVGMAMNDGGYGSFVSEIYEKRGSYNLAQMGSNTIEELKNAHKEADDIVTGKKTTYTDKDGKVQNYTPADKLKAQDQKEKIAAIAETFMHQYGGGADDDQVAQIQQQQALAQQEADAAGATAVDTTDGKPRAGRPVVRTVNTPGAGHVAERVHELADLTGVLREGPKNYYSDPNHSPTRNRREQ